MITNKIKLGFKEMQEVIMLPPKEDFEKIWDIIYNHGFFLKSFTLVSEPLENIFKVSIEGKADKQVIHIKRIWKDKEGIAHTENRDTTVLEYLQKVGELYVNIRSRGIEANIKDQTIDLLLPFHFMQYVIYTELHRPVEYIEPAERTGKKANHLPPLKNHVREYSLTDCIKVYHHKNQNRQYTRHTEQWPRRGSLHHLKSGKVSYHPPTTCHAKHTAETENIIRNYRI